MVQAAEQYLLGEVDAWILYGAVGEAEMALKRYGRDSGLAQMVSEWLEMCDRHRNEFGMAREPISEAQFRASLRDQL